MITYDEAVEKIFSLRRLGMKLGLENIKRFLEKIGNPQEKLKAFHVAGSNGKGSTVAFLSSILTEEGFKTGMFTSPHFVDFTERIKINGKEIDKRFVTNFVNEHIEIIENKEITFFEITTAMAFQYFYESKVDFAVIETGLGGRLDATNTFNSFASIITTISLEHTRILGNSVREIAREKAGIIKQNGKVFCGIMPNEALEEIKIIANKNNAKFFSLKKISIIKDDFAQVKINPNEQITIYRTGFIGSHQIKNAALAVYALKKTLPEVKFSSINKGLLYVKENTNLSGRFEIYVEKPLIIFDAAHNEEGVSVFLSEFERNFSQRCKKKYLIYGALRDKNVEKILPLLRGKFDKIYFSGINFYRALSAGELLQIAQKINLHNCDIIHNPAEFIISFKKSQTNDCLALLGSIYLLGEVKKKLIEMEGL